MIFRIISLENFEGWTGDFKIGDEINCIEKESLREAKEWAYNAYGPLGEDIKHKVIQIK